VSIPKKALSVVLVSLSLVATASAQPSNPTTQFATSLIQAKSVAEQDALLTANKSLVNQDLLAALKTAASVVVRKGDYVEAQRISHIAVKAAEQLGDRLALANALCDLGAAYGRQMTKAAESRKYVQQSLTIFDELGNRKDKARALHAMGIAYGLDRRYDEALKYYEQSLELSSEANDRPLMALTLNSLGLAHSSLGHLEAGQQFYRKSLKLAEELNDKNTMHLALNNIAVDYTNQGRFTESLEYLLRSLRIMEELGPESDRRSLAYKLQNVATVYRHQGNLEQSLVYAQRSLAILIDINDKFGIANLQNNIGVVYKTSGQYEVGLEWFRKALAGFEAIQSVPGIARCNNNMGDVYRLQKRFELAFGPLQKSLELREKINDRGGLTLTLNNLAQLYEDQNKYPEMLEVSQRAEKLAEEVNLPEELWQAQDQIGRAFRALGRPDEARQGFLAAITTLERLRRNVAGGEQQQQGFLDDKLSPWHGLIDLLVAQDKLSEALVFAEQSKARVLLDALQKGRPNLRQSLTEAERKTEEEYRLRLVSLNSQLTTEVRKEKSDAALVASLKQQVEKARLEYEDFETRMYVAHPELRAQRGEALPIKTAELSSLVPDSSTAVLEYVVADKKAYLFVVTRANAEVSMKVYPVAIQREELAQQTEAFRRQLAQRDLGFRATAAKLYSLLIKPAEAELRGKTNLIVIPDNVLWDLPFQALLTPSDRFLLQDASVAYAPSLTVLRDMKGRAAKRLDASATLLALGNPALKQQTNHPVASKLRDGKLEPLPEAEAEVKALARLYGPTRSSVYVGPEAREDRVKSEAGRAKILHFATHGILNNASPMYSYLALAQGGVKEDGMLEAWELMHLDLRADLAVLSACETARGKVGAGEGMIGFSWAMFIAGVPSIVVSQWKVESAGTRDLMVEFHRSLIGKAKVTKAEALREASLKVMKNPQTSHPFYWAGFVLVGDSN
jgi:CHAT domain-containing protein